MTSKWIKLTRPDNAPVWFSIDQIVCIEPNMIDDDGPPNAKTAITATGGSRRFVKEDVDIVEKML